MKRAIKYAVIVAVCFGALFGVLWLVGLEPQRGYEAVADAVVGSLLAFGVLIVVRIIESEKRAGK